MPVGERALARESKLPEQRILRIAQQAASTLAAAHAKGVVHRDIKPENIFLLKHKEMDFVKVVDFGISKSLRTSTEEEEVRLTPSRRAATRISIQLVGSIRRLRQARR